MGYSILMKRRQSEIADKEAAGGNIAGRRNEIKPVNSGDMGLFLALSEYCNNDCYPYHMPGHKRGRLAGDMARYYDIDITEIDGFDDLHHAEGILQEAQLRANRLYGAEETFYLVNGSTCGVLASIMAVTERGGELLIARNCHKSVYHAAILQELALHYYYPPLLDGYGICDGVAAEDVKRLLEEYPDCSAVVITSPTYEGIVSDVKAIADVVHARDKILIVDEAHGAHFGLDGSMPAGAVAHGADLVIHSLHKTLPSMTQTALLHVQGERVNRRKLQEYLRMLQTSSPSYVMMASMDTCIRYLEKHGEERFASLRQQYEIFCKKIECCQYISVGKMTELSDNRCNLTDWDIGKLVIFVQHTSMNGRELYDILREEFHLQMEMAAQNYVLAIMTIMDTEEGWQRLADALLEIDGRIEEDNRAADATECISASAIMIPADAFCREREEVPLGDAESRVAAEFVSLYPPGVPLLVPGEVIDKAVLALIGEYLRCGLRVQGVTAEKKISVVL